MPETIFENYELFIKEHADEIGTPQGALRMLNDAGMFRSYTDSLTEGMDSSKRATIMAVLNRQREMILNSVLQEAANVPNSSFVSGYISRISLWKTEKIYRDYVFFIDIWN